MDINNKLFRVQVKTCGLNNDEKSNTFYLFSSQIHRGKGRHIYTLDEVDYFIFY